MLNIIEYLGQNNLEFYGVKVKNKFYTNLFWEGIWQGLSINAEVSFSISQRNIAISVG